MVAALLCVECGEDVSGNVERHAVDAGHVSSFRLWSCGECRCKSQSVSTISRHCLSSGHSALRVTLADNTAELLEFLGRCLETPAKASSTIPLPIEVDSRVDADSTSVAASDTTEIGSMPELEPSPKPRPSVAYALSRLEAKDEFVSFSDKTTDFASDLAANNSLVETSIVDDAEESEDDEKGGLMYWEEDVSRHVADYAIDERRPAQTSPLPGPFGEASNCSTPPVPYDDASKSFSSEIEKEPPRQSTIPPELERLAQLSRDELGYLSRLLGPVKLNIKSRAPRFIQCPGCNEEVRIRRDGDGNGVDMSRLQRHVLSDFHPEYTNLFPCAHPDCQRRFTRLHTMMAHVKCIHPQLLGTFTPQCDEAVLVCVFWKTAELVWAGVFGLFPELLAAWMKGKMTQKGRVTETDKHRHFQRMIQHS